MVLLTLNLTVWSQCIIHGKSSPDGCKAYTKQQRIECLKAFNDLIHADSTIIAKDSIILIQGDFIKSTDALVLELDKELIQSNNDLDTMRRKRNRGRFLWGGVGILSTILAVISFK